MMMRIMVQRFGAGVSAWRTACVLGAAIMITSPAFGQRTWTNSEGDNDFESFENWTPLPTAFTGSDQIWIINSLDSDRAIISSAIGNVQRDLFVGEAGGQGELVIQTGGSVTVTRNMRLGRSGSATGEAYVTVDGGSLTVSNDIFIGQSDLKDNIFRLQSGSVSSRDMFVAPGSNNRGVLDISGGTFNVSRNATFSDAGSAPTTSVLNLSGDGELTVAGNFSFANNNGGATATATIKDNATLTATNLRIGFGTNSTATLNIEGGIINAPTGFTTFGQGAGSNVIVNMTGGVLNAERINWANELTASATLNMSGGVINVVGTDTNSTSGAFGLRAGEPEIFLTADAVVNAQRLLINDGGTLDLDGAAVMNVTGATDGQATFDFLLGLVSDDWETVKGKINFSSLDSVLQVTGTGQTITEPNTFTYTFANLFTQAIANGVITKNVAGSFQIDYDAVNDLTTLSVVPEPSSAMLALGGLVLLGLSARGRRIQCR